MTCRRPRHSWLGRHSCQSRWRQTISANQNISPPVSLAVQLSRSRTLSKPQSSWDDVRLSSQNSLLACSPSVLSNADKVTF